MVPAYDMVVVRQNPTKSTGVGHLGGHRIRVYHLRATSPPTPPPEYFTLGTTLSYEGFTVKGTRLPSEGSDVMKFRIEGSLTIPQPCMKRV